jgi:methyl-accepting chemotaxis protein
MASFKFRIGTKLGIVTGVSILMVGGIIANQLYGNAVIQEAARSMAANYNNKSSAQSADSAMSHAQLAVNEIGAAPSIEKLEEGLRAFQAAITDAGTQIEATGNRAKRPEVIALYKGAKNLIDRYSASVSELATAQKASIEALDASTRAADAWHGALAPILSSSALAESSNRLGLEAALRESGSLFHRADAALWHFAVTGAPSSKDEVARRIDDAIDVLKRARLLAGDRQLALEIDHLDAAADRLRVAANRAADTVLLKTRLLTEHLIPTAKEIDAQATEGVAFGNRFANERHGELVADLSRIGDIALAVGAMVVLMLIGSALFSVLNIARPIRRIGDVLLALAHSNKSVEVPYSTRGDEVGDAARAAKTFKENLIRIEQMEAAQKDAEAAAAATRKAEMIKLVDAFQASIGGIVNTVSSASSQLESAAGTLTATANSTEELSGIVAAASEEASANVGAVASAAEEMSASVAEIGRQVQGSSRIAGEAVKQAEKTDARITELSQAASRIGDVVKLITAIAEQTNLLALNATIEAARAGEAGRGFAVVASEVKALAAQTAKATDEITTQIAGMQVATQDSVAAIKEIGATIAQISEIAQTVVATLEEQGAATTEIARNVGEAANATSQVADRIIEVNRGASATGAASAQVLTSARALSNESSLLKAEVANFLNTVRAA